MSISNQSMNVADYNADSSTWATHSRGLVSNRVSSERDFNC